MHESNQNPLRSMLNAIKGVITDPGAIKTSVIALGGWMFTWSNAEVFLKMGVLVGTALIVANHVMTIIIRRWCPERRGVGECKFCKLHGRFWCAKGLSKEGE